MVSQAKSSVIVIVLLCTLFYASCTKGKAVLPSVALNAKEMPMMHTENITWLISDSGITRVRLTAAVWDVYPLEKNSQKWHFPAGIYAEKFDSLLNVEASIEADSAYFFENISLWRLIGNVKAVNQKQEKFETSELYWDLKKEKVYSDSLVRVEQSGSEINVIGFESNQEMSKYKYFKIQPSVIYVKNSDDGQSSDTIRQLTQ